MMTIRILGALIVTVVLCVTGTMLGLFLLIRLCILLPGTTDLVIDVLIVGSIIIILGVGMLAGATGYACCFDDPAYTAQGSRWWTVGSGMVWLLIMGYLYRLFAQSTVPLLNLPG